MRRLILFPLGTDRLAASLDDGGGSVGVLIVAGGRQTRIGAHRMAERLAHRLAEREMICMRFDRRGVGDSEGADPGFRGSGPDLIAAANALRVARPGIDRLIGFGLCDGATALALHGENAGLDQLILANPWLVEAEPAAPPPAAIRRRYADQLKTRAGWKRLLGGTIDLRKLARGIFRILRPRRSSSLAAEIAQALAAHRLPVDLILAERDATAIAAEAELKAPAFRGRIRRTRRIDTDAHTFARPGDDRALAEAVAALAQA